MALFKKKTIRYYPFWASVKFPISMRLMMQNYKLAAQISEGETKESRSQIAELDESWIHSSSTKFFSFFFFLFFTKSFS